MISLDVGELRVCGVIPPIYTSSWLCLGRRASCLVLVLPAIAFSNSVCSIFDHAVSNTRLSFHEGVRRRGQINRKILNCCSAVAEESFLLGYETVSVGNLIPTFRHMSPPARARNLQEGKIMYL